MASVLSSCSELAAGCKSAVWGRKRWESAANCSTQSQICTATAALCGSFASHAAFVLLGVVVAAPQALRGLLSFCSLLVTLLAFLNCRPEDLVPAHSSGDAVQPAAGPTTEDELVALSR